MHRGVHLSDVAVHKPVTLGGADCEALRDGFLAQPANAVSSLAYAAGAVYVLARGRRDAVRLGGAAALGLAAVGSVAYHGPQPSWAEAVHDVSVYVLGGAAIFAVVRRRSVDPVAVLTLAAGLVLYRLGRTGAPWCRPESLLQPHAAWHVLTATAAAIAISGRPRLGSRRARRTARLGP